MNKKPGLTHGMGQAGFRGLGRFVTRKKAGVDCQENDL
jgi:hypothetical protein